MPRALQITRFGGPEKLKIIEIPSPTMTSDGVRIAVKASGVNFADVMMRMGLYPEAPKAPFVPGYEISGTVLELGPDVRGLQVGDRVLGGCHFGGYASEVVLPSFQVRRIPAGLSDVEAASIPVNFLTAWVALHEMGRVREGDRVLVQSAAGGVGVAAVQMAARAGAHVVGLVGSDKKREAVLGLGAKEVFLNEEWEAGPNPKLGEFDIVLDPTGGKSLKRSFDRLASSGRVINFGVSSMVGGEKRSIPKAIGLFLNTPLFPPFKLMMANKGVFGLNMLKLFEPPVAGKPDVLGRSLDGVLKGFERGDLKTVVGKTFALEDGGQAQSYLMSRANVGKVVMTC